MKIPGVNSKNVTSLMSKVNSLIDLFEMSEEDINKIIENTKNARLIHEFVNKSIRHDLATNEFGFEDVNDFNLPDDEPMKKDLLKINSKKPRKKTTKK